jgi:hypothetical protein
MKTSDQINEIATALAKAQAAMKPAVKDAVNPAFRSKYADLTAVWDACRIPLTAQGIATVHDVEAAADAIAVTTRLVHTSGQWIECGPLVVPLAKRDAHGVGSATSYAKRYALSAAVGIVSDDDDGNAATEAAPPPRAKSAPKTADKPPARETVNTVTGEIQAPTTSSAISLPQRKRLYVIAKKHGWTDAEVKTLLSTKYGLASSADIPWIKYDEIIHLLEAGLDTEPAA